MGVRKFLDIWTADKMSAQGELSRAQIDEYTMKKLRETVEYAVDNSPFYREHLTSKGVDCEAAKSLETYEDFQKLPFMDQQDLRDRQMELLCVRPGEISRIVTLDTGGSTGKPKRIYFTEEDQQLTVDFFKNGMQLMADKSDRVLILMPAKVPGSVGRLLAEGLRGFGAKAFEYGLPEIKADSEAGVRLTEGNFKEAENILSLMEREKITGVVALPTHMGLLADVMIRIRQRAAAENRSLRVESLKWALLSAEYVAQEQADKISSVFGCRIYEHYGMTEMGLGCAVSCGYGKGYHVRESDIYIEIVDVKTGMPVKDGETGEIVFTTLTRKGMPFIRYRTGDFSRWLVGQCGCGSVLKRLDKVGPRDVVKGYLKGEE